MNTSILLLVDTFLYMMASKIVEFLGEEVILKNKHEERLTNGRTDGRT